MPSNTEHQALKTITLGGRKAIMGLIMVVCGTLMLLAIIRLILT